MAQKRKRPLLKIIDFLQATTSSKTAEHEIVEEHMHPASPKRSKHRDSYDLKWAKEFPWLRYVPDDHEDGPSMLCTICRKHNESSKRMVWITVPCKLLCKDKLREHE